MMQSGIPDRHTQPLLGSEDLESLSPTDSEFNHLIRKHATSARPYHLLVRIVRGVPALFTKISMVKLLLFLLPSFMVPFFEKKPIQSAKHHTSNITALDGLRGLSCLMVMHMHWAFAVSDSYDGGSGEKNAEYFFHRPFFGIFWAGTSHVNVFFVMSGYVLSVKCLKLIHARSSINQAIVSSVFRRAIRIFLPPIALLFIYFVALRMHFFDKATKIWERNQKFKVYPFRMMESTPPIMPTAGQQLLDVLGGIAGLVDPNSPYNLPSYKKYDSHLWTMPTEFYTSMMLYTVLLGTSRLLTKYRLAVHSFLVVYCFLGANYTQGLFLSGLTIAELDLLSKKRLESKRPWANSIDIDPTSYLVNPPSTSSYKLTSYLTITNLISFISFILGLYVLSMPLLYGENTPGYITLFKILPTYMGIEQGTAFIRSLGAIMTVWPITYTSMTADPKAPSYNLIQKVLSNPFTSYLGKISFAFYLTHGFVIRSVGYAILPWIYHISVPNQLRRDLLQDTITNNEAGEEVLLYKAGAKMTSREVGTIWFLGYLIVLPLSIWAADLFWRMVDMKSVTLGKWVEEAMSRQEDEDILETEKGSGKLS